MIYKMNHSYNENNFKYKYVLRITTAQTKITKKYTEIKIKTK